MSLRLTETDDELRRKFYELQSRSAIASLLEVSPRSLQYHLFRRDSYFQFQILKASGQARTINKPSSSLMILQKKLNQVLQAVYKSRSPVHGFVRRKSIRSNAAQHLGAHLVLNLDLENFFPSINFGRVRGLFACAPCSRPPQVAQMLAQICCYNGELPIGAPSSPVIANMICAKLDSALKGLCARTGCTYTRYADDITISTRGAHFHPDICFRHGEPYWSIGSGVENIIRNNGFTINPKKTRVRQRNARQEVTGIRINSGKLNVSKQLVRQVRAMLHAWEQHGEELAETEYWNKYSGANNRSSYPPFRTVLRGKIEFIGFVRGRDDETYQRLLRKLEVLQPGLRSRPAIVKQTTKDSVIGQAIWLLEVNGGTIQGTAFSVADGTLVTAAHNLEGFGSETFQAIVSRPHVVPRDETQYPVTVVSRSDIYDVAILQVDCSLPIRLQTHAKNPLGTGELIKLMGFPRYHRGDNLMIRDGEINQVREFHGVVHYATSFPIVPGDSGAPILDRQNRVIGIAVRGAAVPNTHRDGDQIPSFVSISALERARPQE